MAQISLNQVLKFQQFILDYQAVMREVRVPRFEEKENDLEHSDGLLFLAWYLMEVCGLPLNQFRVFGYCAVHDLPEAYAGDVSIFDEGGRQGKAERERAAVRLYRQNFPEFPELADWIEAYERQSDDEAVFVYALDKLQPMLTIFLEGGTTWRDNDVSHAWLIANKLEKTAGHPVVLAIMRELAGRIDEHAELFPRP